MMKNSLVIFLHQNIWDQSSLEALEVEKFNKYSNVVAYELGHFINKDIISVFKNKLNKRYIKKTASFSEWKVHFLNLIKDYDLNIKNLVIAGGVAANQYLFGEISNFTKKLIPVYKTIQKTKKKLNKNKSLISFVGAPWTLAIYMLGLKKNKNEEENKNIDIPL